MRDHPADNGYAHPIEGVVVTVDVEHDEVVSVEDHGVVPVPAAHGNYDAASVGAMRTDLKPLDIVQPDGPSFEVTGNEVRWQNWRFRVSMHPLDGLVLHTVGYEDQGRRAPDPPPRRAQRDGRALRRGRARATGGRTPSTPASWASGASRS